MEPKRQQLAAANDELATANARLADVQARQATLAAELARREHEYEQAMLERAAAEAEQAHCQRKLDLAHRLVNALTSEGTRWGSEVASLKEEHKLLTVRTSMKVTVYLT